MFNFGVSPRCSWVCTRASNNHTPPCAKPCGWCPHGRCDLFVLGQLALKVIGSALGFLAQRKQATDHPLAQRNCEDFRAAAILIVILGQTSGTVHLIKRVWVRQQWIVNPMFSNSRYKKNALFFVFKSAKQGQPICKTSLTSLR